MAEEAGKDPGLLRRQWRRISEIPFNSDKKYMGAICSKGGEKILFVKGAVDVLLSKCSLAVNPSFQEEETASWGRPFPFLIKSGSFARTVYGPKRECGFWHWHVNH